MGLMGIDEPMPNPRKGECVVNEYGQRFCGICRYEFMEGHDSREHEWTCLLRVQADSGRKVLDASIRYIHSRLDKIEALLKGRAEMRMTHVNGRVIVSLCEDDLAAAIRAEAKRRVKANGFNVIEIAPIGMAWPSRPPLREPGSVLEVSVPVDDCLCPAPMWPSEEKKA